MLFVFAMPVAFLSVGTTTAGTVLFTLPAGFRPVNNVICLVGTETSECLLLIGPNGNVTIQRYVSGSYLMLNTVSFAVYQ